MAERKVGVVESPRALTRTVLEEDAVTSRAGTICRRCSQSNSDDEFERKRDDYKREKDL